MTLYEAIPNPDTPLVNQLVEWALEVFRRSGANIHMGLELPRVFSEAGLPAPVAHLGAPAGTGPGWVGYKYLPAQLRQPAAPDGRVRHRHGRGG